MKDIANLNSLINQESEVVKTYENYLQNDTGELLEPLQNIISKHNNHIQALKNISRR